MDASIDPIADVVVAGGGPAGAAAAIGLSRAGARVVLLERDAAAPFKPGEILEPTIAYSLRELGLHSGFDSLASLPLAGTLSFWGTGEPIEVDSILNPHGCGYFVDRRRFEAWLLDEARRLGVVIERGLQEIRIEAGAPSCATWVRGGRRRRTRAPLVVDATGRGRGVAGPADRTRLDRLVGLLAYVPEDPDRVSDRRLYIEAAPDGWWYSAPLPGGCSVIAFMTDADLIPAGRDRQLAFFRQRLKETRATRWRVGDDAAVTAVRSCAAMSTMRRTISGAGWVAIGDAAATYDPLSGRGVAAALSKGTGLARLIARSGAGERALREYAEAERAAYQDYLVMHRAIYGRERRWPSSVFWRRRH